MAKWTESTALTFLARIGVKPLSDKTFEIKSGECGIGAWGAIDYLCGEHGYRVTRQREHGYAH